MKRTCLAVLSLILATAAFAADTQRYLIGTRRPLDAGARTAIKQIVGEDFENRTVVPFATFNGFAADLTKEDVVALQQSGEVRWVEPVLERHAFAQVRHPLRQAVPTGLSVIHALAAQTGLQRETVNVVVVDTGIDYRHPDLQDAYAGGYNFLNNTDNPLDDDGHGSHVSGTIAAADNGIGIIGVAPHVRLWSVKILDGQGHGTSEGLIKAIDWVTAKKEALGGNWIMNFSLGGATASESESEAFQRVADKGVLVIAAAGNLSTAGTPSPVKFPAAYPSVIAVAATTPDNQHASFSDQGPELDFSAPGVDILSTWPVGTIEISFVADGDSATFAHELRGSKRGVVSAEFVYCGLGKPGQVPASVAGKIALIQRGEITFPEKARRAKEAGAIAVAIFDNVPEPEPGSWILDTNDENRAYAWPVTVRLTQQTGQELLAKGPHTITVAFTNDDYGESSGTSMSCPHVAGAAALIWAVAPNATAQQVVNALTTTATDLGAPGPDSLFGVGLINANAAARLLAPEAFSNITTGRPVGQRGRH